MDVRQFIEASMEGLRLQTDGHAATWHLGDEKTWNANQDTGELRFTFSDGVTATTQFQSIGTYDTLDSTFLWGWDHPSVVEPLREHAKLAKAWGTKNGIQRFTTRKVKCSEQEAWEFTAVAARLANANGAYRGPAGTTMVFMTFGTITLEKAKP